MSGKREVWDRVVISGETLEDAEPVQVTVRSEEGTDMKELVERAKSAETLIVYPTKVDQKFGLWRLTVTDFEPLLV